MRQSKMIIIFIAAILLMGVITFIRVRIAAKNRPMMEEMPDRLEQKILTFELVNYTNDGSKKWELKGDSADILAEIVNLSNINMTTYDEPMINLTALNGTYNKENKVVSLFDEVEAITSDGAKITTDYLMWDGATDTITTDKPVRIERGDVVTDGTGAIAMPQMKRVILDKDVTVRLAKSVVRDIDMSFDEEEVKEDGKQEETPTKATITCKGPLEIDYEKNIAIFNKDVKVDDKKGQIYSDRMEAFMDPETKNIIEVVAEGEVRVVRGKDSTYSQKAIYRTADQKIILVGKPKIFIHSSTKELDKMEEELEGL